MEVTQVVFSVVLMSSCLSQAKSPRFNGSDKRNSNNVGMELASLKLDFHGLSLATGKPSCKNRERASERARRLLTCDKHYYNNINRKQQNEHDYL